MKKDSLTFSSPQILISNIPTSPDTTKTTVQVEYGKIVQLTDTFGVEWQREHICKPIFDPIAAQYPQKSGYLDEANLGLGCGFPVEYA